MAEPIVVKEYDKMEISNCDLDKLQDYLKSGKAKNTLVKIGKITSQGAVEFVNTIKDSL